MKRIIVLITILLLVFITSACNDNIIKKINDSVMEEDKFISISIFEGESIIPTRGRILQKDNNIVREINIFYENEDVTIPVYELIDNNNIMRILYIEYIFDNDKCYITEWKGKNKIENKFSQQTIDKSFSYIFNTMSFQESPRGLMISHNKVDSNNKIGESYIFEKKFQIYSGKFNLINDTSSPSYKGEYIVGINEEYKTGYELYDISYRDDNYNHYRKFWFGNDVELVLNDYNDNFPQIFQVLFEKAEFDLFINEISDLK